MEAPKQVKMDSGRRVSVIVVICCVTVVASLNDFNIHFNDLLSCKDICDKYAFHSGGKGDMWECCARGCRFHSVMSFLRQPRDINTTIDNCAANCDEAYSRQANRQACHWGCHGSQQHTPELAKEDSQQGEEDVAMTHMLYPLLYMHSMYSNMLFKVHRHFELHWSLFTQSSSGELVVLRSQPLLIQLDSNNTKDQEETQLWVDHKTSANLETNIVGQDNSATPLLNVRHSQISAAHRPDPDSQGLQLDEDGRVDWWACVVRKTDLARIVLSFLILVTVVVLVWVCLTASPSAPQQTLSINGDLDYLHTMTYKDGFQLLHPQDRVQACPLPIKICVERI